MPAPDIPDWITAERRKLGAHIQHLRRTAGLTQDEVVRRSGVDRRTYQRMEAGESDTRISRYQAVARAIGVPLAELVRVAEPPR